MPIYEYRCLQCRKKVTVLTLRVSEVSQPVCEHCGSTKLDRLMSRFAMPRSEDARLNALADPQALGDVDESDPKSMARWMRKMGQEVGDDLGDDFGQMVDELEAGEPDSAPDTGGEGIDE